MPDTLKVDGLNPLAIIYDCLSQGLHALPDEECLELADAIKHSLTYLLEEIQRAKDKKREFSDNMRKILDKRRDQKP